MQTATYTANDIEFICPDEYADYLRYGTDQVQSHIPGDFIHDLQGVFWFVSGGSQCVGSAVCDWHGGPDSACYAVGSCTIANAGINGEYLSACITELESIKYEDDDALFCNQERLWLIELFKFALASNPDEECQCFE